MRACRTQHSGPIMLHACVMHPCRQPDGLACCMQAETLAIAAVCRFRAERGLRSPSARRTWHRRALLSGPVTARGGRRQAMQASLETK